MSQRFVAALVLVGTLAAAAHAPAGAPGGTFEPERAAAATPRTCRERAATDRVVLVSLAADLPELVRRSPPGTTFCLRRGIHRLARDVVPRTGDVFAGEAGAVVSGAKDISQVFVPRRGRWRARGQDQQNPVVHGTCASGAACRYADDVFFDDRPLRRVLARSALAPGTFYFDYAADEIWIADDPRGHRVEAAVTTRAFRGSDSGAENVIIERLVIEKFANEAQIGAINARPSWIVRDSEVRLNHGVGIQDAGTIVRSHVHHNGQLGVGGAPESGARVVGNEIDHNNYAGFDGYWEAGGGKWLRTSGLTISANFVHHNDGPGLWTDTDNVETSYLRNRVSDNTGPGILHETSYAATVAYNDVRRNGRKEAGWLDGAGIVISSSSAVDVHDNRLVDNWDGIGLIQTDRGSGRFGPHVLRDVRVRRNRVEMPSGRTGLVSDTGDPALFSDNGNRFEGNTYLVGCTQLPFAWASSAGSGSYAYVDWRTWVAAGNDTSGAFRARCPWKRP